LLEQGRVALVDPTKFKEAPTHRDHTLIKEEYPDALIFYRLGDFYESFAEDAKTMAQELDLVLTSRRSEQGGRIAMAGVPCYLAERHIVSLLEKGYRVMICE